MDKRRIFLLSASHFINDSYHNFLPLLLPFLMPTLNMSLAMAGLLITCQQLVGSLTQPIFGHFSDRYGTRMFAFLGTGAMALGASFLSVAPNYVVLLLLVMVASLGTSAFHPQSAAMVNALSGERKGSIMSLYIWAGTSGFALGPLIITLAVTTLGLTLAPVIVLPGLTAAVLLAFFAPKHWMDGMRQGPSLVEIVTRNSALIFRLLGVASFRSITFSTFVAFLPIFFKGEGMDPKVTASIITVLLLAGSLGGLLGGYLSDLLGRRKVVVVSFFLAAPFSFLLIHSGGVWLWLAAALAGATLLGSFSVLTIQAQELMPENVGMASGLMLGFAIGVGGISVGAAGLLAERIGVGNTLNLVVLFPVLSALIAMSLKDRPRPKDLPLA